jgi:predicted molibdopterin-dependent oxidoreductase YjgC
LLKGALRSELPQILLRMNMFVTETVDLAAIRLPICGFLQIDMTRTISISTIRSIRSKLVGKVCNRQNYQILVSDLANTDEYMMELGSKNKTKQFSLFVQGNKYG